jgi:hypothetical protein
MAPVKNNERRVRVIDTLSQALTLRKTITRGVALATVMDAMVLAQIPVMVPPLFQLTKIPKTATYTPMVYL